MKDLDEHEATVVREFLENHWALFLAHAEPFDVTEAQADDILNKLSGGK